ncbi:four helix bundle protein [Pedobacter sp. LMG 31464]|uniref:Four helix bundle protein n=1 Tax=Pedobacter planticolens TaxID=2679964 RepID=A0A923DYD3_9SPHI|nr:four helix bundle protein [Pedobacter planticolens]MBB2145375.1 four helix bundle protein [Pedobacter planticolens]
MSYNRIEDLEVYMLAEEFSNEVWDVAAKWDYFAKDTVGKQVYRCADSISANIAEGYGRFHFKENKNFCYYSRGSILETKSFLRKMKHRSLVTSEGYENLFNKLEIIHIKLNAYIKFIGKRSVID